MIRNRPRKALQESVRESVKPLGRCKEMVNLTTSGLNSIVRPSVLKILNGDINKIEFGYSFMKFPNLDVRTPSPLPML